MTQEKQGNVIGFPKIRKAVDPKSELHQYLEGYNNFPTSPARVVELKPNRIKKGDTVDVSNSQDMHLYGNDNTMFNRFFRFPSVFLRETPLFNVVEILTQEEGESLILQYEGLKFIIPNKREFVQKI
jgi:hypothetical protein